MVLVFMKMEKEVGEVVPRLKWLALFQKMMEEVAAELVQKKLLTLIVTVKGGSSHICEINDILNSSGLVALSIQKLYKSLIDGFLVLLIRRSMLVIWTLKANCSELNKADVLLLSFL